GGLRGGAEGVGLAQAEARAEETRGEHGEPGETTDEVGGRAVEHAAGDRGPDALVAELPAGPGDEGPEDPATDQGQRGGQDEDDGRQHDDEADGSGQTEPAGAGHGRQQQGGQGEHDGGVAREDRRHGGAPRGRQRPGVALLLVQLLAIARDQQQGVVGAGAEDEDRDDARVEGESTRLADSGREPPGHLVGDTDDGQRDEPQDGGAVGEQEQQRDHADGDREEGDVRTVEG